MDYVKQLKNKRILRVLPVSLFLIAFSAALFIYCQCWLLFVQPADLYSLSADQLKGAYVTAEIPFIYGSYAYTEEYQNNISTGKILSTEYVIDANATQLMGLELGEKSVSAGDKLLEDSMAYFYGEAAQLGESIVVTGTVFAMPSDSLNYYHEMIGYDSMSSADQALYLPLYLREGYMGRTSRSTSATVLLCSCLCVIISVFCLLYAIFGKQQNQILRRAKELGNGNAAPVLQQIAALHDQIPDCHGLRFNSSLILCDGAQQFLYSVPELVWAYQNTVQHRTNGIPTGKTYYLVLRMMNGDTRQIAMPEEEITAQLEKLGQLMPHVIIGYSDQLEEMYRTDRVRMSLLREQAVQEQQPMPQPELYSEGAQEVPSSDSDV